jgi:hypothetical protein
MTGFFAEKMLYCIRRTLCGSMKNTGKKSNSSGQVISEYAIMLAMFAGIAVLLVFLLAVFTEYGWRVLSLVNDFPYSL